MRKPLRVGHFMRTNDPRRSHSSLGLTRSPRPAVLSRIDWSGSVRCFRFRGIVWSILSCIVLILAPFISRGSQQAFAYTTLQVAVDNYYNGYVHLTVGRYSQFKPVTATGGSGSVIYSISPALPSGLNIVADTGLIFGVLTQSTGLVNYTITAFDTVTTNSASATINIHAHSALSVNVSISSKTVSVNTYQAGFTPVTVSGGANPVTCSISPPAPPRA